MVWNLPILLTWLRIFAIPAVVVLFEVGRAHPLGIADPSAGLLFAAASITDSLDGWLARRWKQTTALGAFLDPVADKLIVAAALVLLASRDPRLLLVNAAIVIVGREIAVSALREWMAEIGQRARVGVSELGKLKTILQMVGLTLLLYRHDWLGLPIYRIGMWFTVAAAVLTLLSMLDYLRAALPYLSGHPDDRGT
ncbi:MAG: CDP-diacylglycerol--glycerol-3-phosphate 3-phosphatidyltransferase [Pseudomonadota bacterium]|jgi:CDP-diacylglycerol--glycerol-3-phosphate 3-phosphatidyltransferase